MPWKECGGFQGSQRSVVQMNFDVLPTDLGIALDAVLEMLLRRSCSFSLGSALKGERAVDIRLGEEMY